MDSLARRDTSDTPGAATYRIAGGLTAWFLLVAAIAYGQGRYAPVVIAVCVIFAVISLGLPALIVRMNANRGKPGAPGRDGARSRQALETASGPLRPAAARLQILIVPVSLAVGFTFIGLVAVLVA